MSNFLLELNAQSLMQAIAANLIEYWKFRGSSPHVYLQDWPEKMLFTSGFEHPMWNAVLCARFEDENVDAEIEGTLNYFKLKNVPCISWFTDPTTRPSNLGEHLEAHGFKKTYNIRGMAMDLLQIKEDVPAIADFSVKHVDNMDVFEEFLNVAKAGFVNSAVAYEGFCNIERSLGFSQVPRHLYVGFLGDMPISTSTLFLGGGVAGIHWVSTLPKWRGKGIGTAMMLIPLRKALDMGYRVGVLHSSERQHEIYRRLGFEEYCNTGCYIWADKSNDGR